MQIKENGEDNGNKYAGIFRLTLFCYLYKW